MWEAQETLPDLSNASIISFDVETCDPNLLKYGPGGVRNDGFLVGLSVATNTGFCGYFPIAHQEGGNLDRDKVLAWAQKTLGGIEIKVGANLLYDCEWLRASGVNVGGLLYDIQVAEPLINENSLCGYSLSALAKRYLGIDKNEDVLIKEAKSRGLNPKSDMWKLPASAVGLYAEADAKLPLLIWEKQEVILKEQDLWPIFELESRLLNVMREMRFKGVRIDMDKAELLNKKLHADENSQLLEIAAHINGAVNCWSNLDLARAFDKLKIWFPRTDKGNPSFVSEWLNNHKEPFPKLIAKYRKTNKMRRDFIEGVCLNMSKNGRIYTQFHSLRKDSSGTRTGRFSSSTPNLQQVPARDEYWGPLIRGLFLPDEGKKWACLDYNQQEPRVLLHYAFECKLKGAKEAVELFKTNDSADFHQIVADMAGINRKIAKTINLGMFYGMGIKKLSAQLDISYEEGKSLFEDYHAKVPFVRQLAHECSISASRKGTIETLLGRRRRFDMWEPINRWMSGNQSSTGLPLQREKAIKRWPGQLLRRAYTYKALNALIQGTSADMTKQAMIDLYEIGVVPHIQVHDELDFSISSDDRVDYYKEIMEQCVSLHVPLKVDVEIGETWGEIK